MYGGTVVRGYQSSSAAAAVCCSRLDVFFEPKPLELDRLSGDRSLVVVAAAAADASSGALRAYRMCRDRNLGFG